TDEVRRIEAPAEAHRDHADVDPDLPEPLAREQRGKLEVRESDAGRGEVGAQLGDERYDGRAGNGASVDADALGEIDEMGRRVESGPVAGRPQHRVEHGGRRRSEERRVGKGWRS